MNFQLNRLYSIKTKAFWAHCRNWLLFIAIVLVFCLVQAKPMKTETLAAFALISIIHIGSFFWELPKQFTVENGELTLWMYLDKPLPDGVTINRRRYRTARFLVTVRQIEKIEYRSDVDEKIGALRLYGQILTQDKKGTYVDPCVPLEMVELVGVKSFRKARYQLQKEFPEAVFTRID